MLSHIYKASTADGELLDGLLCAPHYDITLQKIKDTLAIGKSIPLSAPISSAILKKHF